MEKLWTTSEAARFLGVNEAVVEQLVQQGRLTGYKLAGQFLRFRPDQVQELKAQGVLASTTVAPVAARRGWAEKTRDFIYFYDFYLLAFVLLAALIIYLISVS